MHVCACDFGNTRASNYMLKFNNDIIHSINVLHVLQLIHKLQIRRAEKLLVALLLTLKAEVYSEHCQTSKMKLFTKIVDGLRIQDINLRFLILALTKYAPFAKLINNSIAKRQITKRQALR